MDSTQGKVVWAVVKLIGRVALAYVRHLVPPPALGKTEKPGDTENGDPRLSPPFLYSHSIGVQAGCAVCGQDRRQSASALPQLSLATANLGGGQRRAALAMLGGAHFLGM